MPFLGTSKRLSEFNLSNKIVLVSGAARGLGLTQAEALLEAGATGTFPVATLWPRSGHLMIIAQCTLSIGFPSPRRTFIELPNEHGRSLTPLCTTDKSMYEM